MMQDRCQVKINGKRCRNPAALIYYDHLVCQADFDKHSEGYIDLKKIFNIVEEKALPTHKETREILLTNFA